MVIRNAKLRKKDGLYDITYENGVFTSINPAKEFAKDILSNLWEISDVFDEVDVDGRVVMEPFVEPHIHLDCVLTAGIPHYNMSGTLFEGISTWHEYKTSQPLVVSEIKDRARQALRMMASYGVQFVRTHVDITETSFKGVQALEELKEEMKDYMEIQTIAFPQNGILSFRDENGTGKDYMKKALDAGMDVVGGIPHFEYTREYGIESLKFIFEMAEKYDKPIDVHCDEIDDGSSRFLETLATLAWEREMGDRTVAAHTCAMGSYNDAYCTKLFRLLKDSKVSFNSCPNASIHLQGRIDTYPKRRGLTRIKELYHEGINVCLGQDSISDPWYPMGVGDLLRVLDSGIHIAQMTGYEDLKNCLDLISVNGAHNLCLDNEYGIKTGKKASFIVLDGKDDLDIISHHKPVVLSVHNGKIIAKRKPERSIVEF